MYYNIRRATILCCRLPDEEIDNRFIMIKDYVESALNVYFNFGDISPEARAYLKLTYGDIVKKYKRGKHRANVIRKIRKDERLKVTQYFEGRYTLQRLDLIDK